MFDLTHGFLFFIIGMTMTITGFFIENTSNDFYYLEFD